MSFLYPRTLSIRRPRPNQTAGLQPYSGQSKAAEDVIATGLPASIQLNHKSGPPQGGTPSDAYNRSGYDILIPRGAAALGSICERDIVVDDLGKRYEVTGAYWNSLGYNLSAEMLQV
jgi:hypothetical protein